MMRLTRMGLLALSLSSLACSQRDATKSVDSAAVAAPMGNPGANTRGIPIELFSWWARVGESDALGALMRVHNKRVPQDTMINASAELSGLARKTLTERMHKGEPPDTFQANIGYDLDQWVIVNGLDARESRLLPLDDELPSEVADWRAHMPKILLGLLSYDGKMYGVPTNVHRINSVFYNKRIFEKYGLDEPKNVADFDRLAQRLEGSQVPLFAVGSREPWTLALLVFECLLPAEQGPQFYQDFLHGGYKADDPRVVSVLRKSLHLLKFANADHRQLSWLQALDLVARGHAAMTVMGDWARVSFNARGLKLGIDYDEMAFPQTSGTLVFTSDAFSLPRGSKNREGAKRLLATMGSLEGQVAMNTAKSALAARTDAEPADDAQLAYKHRLLSQGSLVLALSGIVPPRFAEDIGQALAESVKEDDIEPALLTLRSRYALLR